MNEPENKAVGSLDRREAIDSLTKTMRELVSQVKDENHKLHETVSLLRDAVGENYWCYQGDDEDRLESLTCAVLIRPERLRELIAAAEANTAATDEPPARSGLVRAEGAIDANADAWRETPSAEPTPPETDPVCPQCGNATWTRPADVGKGRISVACTRCDRRYHMPGLDASVLKDTTP